jgi:hypothetical protein
MPIQKLADASAGPEVADGDENPYLAIISRKLRNIKKKYVPACQLSSFMPHPYL